ncbi:hypothetical protein SDC9_113961 [bioreactor metagenome]|uniref:Uncharacterized protein n=1 Tax=bioreactor metagenome TaxID=1076179 RepID=A0A645BP52_9ZZZZ
MGNVAGKEEELVGVLPDLGLVDEHPVGLSFGLQVGDGFTHAGYFEEGAPQPAQRFLAGDAALIQPVNGRTQGCAVCIYINEGGALSCQRYACDRFFLDTGHRP